MMNTGFTALPAQIKCLGAVANWMTNGNIKRKTREGHGDCMLYMIRK